MWEWLRSKWWVLLLGILVVPVLAYLNMKQRKARELAETTHSLDERISDLKLLNNRDGVFIVYPNGKQILADALGIAVVTRDDYRANSELFKLSEVKEDDYPVVVFFNVTGFDTTGVPRVVRRVKDGEQLVPLYGKPEGKRVKAAVLLPSGWAVYYWNAPDDNGKVIANGNEWDSTYLGGPSPWHKPTPEEISKMSSEERKILGVTLPKQDKEKEKPLPESKTGIKGYLIKVGGTPAIQPLKASIHAFKGKITPDPKLTNKDNRIIKSATSDENGKYSLDLEPGVYTLVIELNGKFYGNAYKQDSWPSVTVKDKWVDYDFRKGVGD